jgi:hypothetical protein
MPDLPQLAGPSADGRIVGPTDVRVRLRGDGTDLQRRRHGPGESKTDDVYLALLPCGRAGRRRPPLPQPLHAVRRPAGRSPDPLVPLRRHERDFVDVAVPRSPGSVAEPLPPPAPALLQHLPLPVPLPRIRGAAAPRLLPQPPLPPSRAAPLG